MEIDHLRVALDRRTIVGQAQGMLMERLGIDADQAIAYLKRMSNHRNRKLFAIAEDIVRTRELPERAVGQRPTTLPTARPTARPEKMQPPRNVPSSAL